MKTHWKKVFNKDYLGACDLEDGKDLKAIISHVEAREIKGNSGELSIRNVAIFKGDIKPMVLNVTNSRILKAFTQSPYIEDWKNIPIQIYAKNDVKAFGDIVEGLRFRNVQPKMGKPELLPNTPQWQKAVEFLQGVGTIEQIKTKYSLSEANKQLLMDAAL